MGSDTRNWNDLPEPIIQRIQSFISDYSYYGNISRGTGERVLLSKSWFRAWSTSPALCFRQPKYSEEAEFSDLVYNTLLRYRQNLLLTEKLCVSIDVKSCRSVASNLKEWLQVARETGLIELDVTVKLDKDDEISKYILPHEIFAIESLRTLRLFWNAVFPDGSANMVINWRSLVCLDLSRVSLDEQMIQKLFCDCPLIETFILYCCDGFTKFKLVNAHHLHTFSYTRSTVVEFELDAPNICSFYYASVTNLMLKPCDFSIGASRSLTCLTLYKVGISDLFFINFASKFPFVKDLAVACCNLLRKVNISHASLTKLTIRYCNGVKEVKIEGPKLLYLNFVGSTRVFAFTNVSPGQLEQAVLLLFQTDDIGASLFHSLREVLSRSRNSVVLVFTEESTKIKYDDLHHLAATSFQPHGNLKLGLSGVKFLTPSAYSAIWDAFLTAFRPNYISPYCSGKDDDYSVKLVLKNLMDRTNPSCCTCGGEAKCWRHYLKDARIGRWETSDAGNVWDYEENRWKPLSIEWEALVEDLTVKLEWLCN